MTPGPEESIRQQYTDPDRVPPEEKPDCWGEYGDRNIMVCSQCTVREACENLVQRRKEFEETQVSGQEVVDYLIAEAMREDRSDLARWVQYKVAEFEQRHG